MVYNSRNRSVLVKWRQAPLSNYLIVECHTGQDRQQTQKTEAVIFTRLSLWGLFQDVV